jgi:hypothetical protein
LEDDVDIVGSHLILQAALDRAGDGERTPIGPSARLPNSPFAHELHNHSDRDRQSVTVKFAAVTGLVTAFVGMLIAVAVVTDSPDNATTAGQPAPVAAPTAALDAPDGDRSIILAGSLEPSE